MNFSKKNTKSNSGSWNIEPSFDNCTPSTKENSLNEQLQFLDTCENSNKSQGASEFQIQDYHDQIHFGSFKRPIYDNAFGNMIDDHYPIHHHQNNKPLGLTYFDAIREQNLNRDIEINTPDDKTDKSNSKIIQTENSKSKKVQTRIDMLENALKNLIDQYTTESFINDQQQMGAKIQDFAKKLRNIAEKRKMQQDTIKQAIIKSSETEDDNQQDNNSIASNIQSNQQSFSDMEQILEEIMNYIQPGQFPNIDNPENIDNELKTLIDDFLHQINISFSQDIHNLDSQSPKNLPIDQEST